ncbi:hypothetical protein JI435_414480 [Parastagonospora nodorum SN15]|uniref:Uncharacterized protein n=1 Tax=Phaeosphaeria nodorum (strain SN15 / ATCC MYA-4574 / FGSC 10173) TaxID=321614 RepID=A0A7U2F796_PHANO|nr:hypothetical protein JI435_414480 [Parastagonospora nodorum SN15]
MVLIAGWTSSWLSTGGIGAFACAERHVEDTSFPYVKHDSIMRLIGARGCCQSVY